MKDQKKEKNNNKNKIFTKNKNSNNSIVVKYNIISYKFIHFVLIILTVSIYT